MGICTSKVVPSDGGVKTPGIPVPPPAAVKNPPRPNDDTATRPPNATPTTAGATRQAGGQQRVLPPPPQPAPPPQVKPQQPPEGTGPEPSSRTEIDSTRPTYADLVSLAKDALADTLRDAAEALQYLPYAGAVFGTIKVFFQRAQLVKANEQLFRRLAFCVWSAVFCLAGVSRAASVLPEEHKRELCSEQHLRHLKAAVDKASALMIGFDERGWFTRIIVAPRIAEEVAEAREDVDTARRALQEACAVYLAQRAAAAHAEQARQKLEQHEAQIASRAVGSHAAPPAETEQQGMQAVRDLLSRLQSALRASGLRLELSKATDDEVEAVLAALHQKDDPQQHRQLLHEVRSATQLSEGEVREAAEDAANLVKERRAALPLDERGLLQLRALKGRRDKYILPPLSRDGSTAPPDPPGKCMAWVPARKEKGEVIPGHKCSCRPRDRVQVEEEFFGFFFTCGKHRTHFDAYPSARKTALV